MRIALAHSHPNTLGGGERALLELARGLATRHEVRLLVGNYRPDQTFADLATFPRWRLSAPEWLVHRPSDDVVVANSFGANLLSLRNGQRVIYWVHSLRSLFLAPGARRPDLVLRRALDRVAVRKAARLVANSRFTAGRLRTLYGREADAIVYPGVDLHLFRPQGGQRNYAITVGRLSPEKGLDRLFQFWCGLPGIPLQVVGDGRPEEVSRLRALAPPSVVFRGPLEPSELAAAYREAMFAAFTPHAEEFGIAPLEAMACGTPVLALREGGLAESIVDGQTGYLASDGATFQERARLLAGNEDLRRSLGAAARARAEQFTWQRTVAAMEQICSELATPARPQP
jgi:glycosyltransferase involved in cell wall biosynthesis